MSRCATPATTIWENLSTSKLYLTGGIGASGGARSVRQALRAAEHDGLQRNLRVGRDGLLEPPPVPAPRRREVHRHDGAHALQRPDLRRRRSTARRSSIPIRSNRTASTRAASGSASPAAPATSRASCRRCPATSTRRSGDTLYVNLYAGGTADIELPGGKLKVVAGDALSVGRRGEDDGRRRTRRARFALNIRIPGWARERAGAERSLSLPGRARAAATMKVNGAAGADDDRQGIRHDRSRVEGRRQHRPQSPDAGPAHRRERRKSRPIAIASRCSAARSSMPPSGRTIRTARCATSCCPTRTR